jgi:glycerol-3-phosphate O-acyltransferase/dihydroxyacetone phosphate acyltransferase
LLSTHLSILLTLPPLAGVAIIALGALAKGIPITVVPVGLTYMSAHKFRSRAIIEFGDAVSIDSATIHEFKGNKKRGAISRLMSDIDISLKSVTVSAPDFDTLQVRFVYCSVFL